MWVINLSTTLFIGTSIYSGLYNQILLYYDENLIPFIGTVNIVCGIFLYSYYLDNLYFNIGGFFIICGYICKLQNIHYDVYWGTAVFHIFTAIGIHILVYMDKPQLKNNVLHQSKSLTVLNGL
jgi:hypothetical protein